MKMAAFEHHRPTSLDDALALLAEHGADAKVVAGGQSLVPMLAMRLSTPAHLVDISRIAGLDEVHDAGGALRVPARVRHAQAEASPLVREMTPLLAAALPWIGHRAIRNRGTVCGSIAHADPAAELPAVALALDATMIVHSVRGERTVPAREFFQGYLTTGLAEDEMLLAVHFPGAGPGTGVSVAEVARRHGDFALAGVVCQVRAVDGLAAEVAIACFGVGDTPVRADAAEAGLRGVRLTAAGVAEAAASVRDQVRPSGDVHATAAYRRHVVGVLAGRALRHAAAGAGLVVEAAA